MEEKYQIHKKKCDGKFYAILSFDNKTLRAELKRLGLDFQTVKGLWKDEKIIVWKTCYLYMSFKRIMFKLNTLFKHKTLCMGRNVGDEYDVRVYQFDETCEEKYKLIDDYLIDTVVSLVTFGELSHNVCLSSAKCLMGAYKRERLEKELLARGEDKNEKCED